MAVLKDCCEGGALLLLLGEDTVGDDAIMSEALWSMSWWEGGMSPDEHSFLSDMSVGAGNVCCIRGICKRETILGIAE